MCMCHSTCCDVTSEPSHLTHYLSRVVPGHGAEPEEVKTVWGEGFTDAS